jgi:HEAT repeat protein
MEPLTLLGLLGASIAAASGVRAVTVRRRWAKHLDVWWDAANASGATAIETKWGADRWVVSGWWGQLHFKIEERRRDHICVVVCGREQLLQGVSIRPEDVGTRLAKLRPAGREIDVGDDAFDAAFYIGGIPAQVHALLDAATRRDLMDLASDGRVEISGGEIWMELHVYALYRTLLVLRRCAERMTGPLGLADHLAANAGCDPERRVRLLNLLVLVRELRGLDITDKALRTACSDPDPEIRLRAATELEQDGHATLAALAEGDTDVAARAVSALGIHLGVEKTRTILGRALDAKRLDVACACIENVGRFSPAVVVDNLLPFLSSRHTEVAVSAATAIRWTSAPEIESALLVALASFDQKLRVAAAEALGRVGSVSAVPKLKEAANSERDDLQRAAREAIAWIQARVPEGAAAGQLSLASAEAGQLSLAEPTSGRLSLAEQGPDRARRSD